MSFQLFRLGELPVHQPAPPANATKQPYGSGDTEDGYTLVFPNLAAFQEWRDAEEERNCVEFVKGDTHGSKADPPRFKDHTKLVCARHSRSGRKKYVKKHPERVRKVPSRKLEGQGCPASISFKTYFDTEEVRACYISQHSHEIGPANLPYTRRGRKAAVQQEKERGRNKSAGPEVPPVASSSTAPPVGLEPQQGPSQAFSTAVSMLAPLPGPTFPAPAAQPYGYAPPMPAFPPVQGQQNLPHERWENMATLFQTIREHARAFEYPAASVAALETVLIRLYLESPMGLSPAQTMGTLIHNSMLANRHPSAQPAPNTNGHQHLNGHANDGGSSSNALDAS